MVFRNRRQAGALLAEKLRPFKELDPVVLALPRGGVPVAAQVAKRLGAALDVLAVRKIGAPLNPEFAVGAVSEDGSPILNLNAMAQLDLDENEVESIAKKEMEEIRRQVRVFRGGRAPVNVKGRVAIVVDDGLATGATASAALKFLKLKGARRVIIAVPVAGARSAARLRSKADQVITVEEPEDFLAVGHWYEHFGAVSDEEVIKDLAVSARSPDTKDENLTRRRPAKNAKGTGIEAAVARDLIPATDEPDLASLINAIKDKRVVMLGEATHGTKEFYVLRRLISQILIRDHGFRFIAVEGDWPDLYRLNRYISKGEGRSAVDVLSHNHRWPTWMWANTEVVRLAEWMRRHGGEIFGLDVYSLFESMDSVLQYMRDVNSEVARRLEERYACFDPFERDEIAYARQLAITPAGCRRDVLENLQELLKLRLSETSPESDEFFGASQNARIVVNAEDYYRAMLEADAESWNIRDRHMMETLDRLLQRSGETAKAIVWAHNTHIGDYRATDMEAAGYVNIGGLARQRYGHENVALVGFGTHHGQVLAGHAWGAAEEVMNLPTARKGSLEDVCHGACVERQLSQFYLIFNDDPSYRQFIGHRAVGVVYDPEHEGRGQYVPTIPSRRYDAYFHVDGTRALKSLHSIFLSGEIPETWPAGL